MNGHRPSVGGQAAARPTSADSKLGILSQTVFTSPDCKFISEARLRSKALNDVVLVGESAVHVKEIVKDGDIVPVATRADFPARILCAGVVGYMESLDVTLRSLTVQFEHKVAQGGGGHDEWQAEPRQVLVLTFDSSYPNVMLLSMTEASPGCYEFSTAVVPLPVMFAHDGRAHHRSPVTNSLGAHLAIDPYSRAVAVSDFSQKLLVLEAESISSLDNIQHLFGRKKMVRLDGDMAIARMAFLYPEHGNNHILYLLVLGYRGEKRHLTVVVYEWSRVAQWNPIILSQQHETRLHHDLPTILAPLAKIPGAFMVACSRRIAIYEEAHRGNLRQTFMRSSSREKDDSEVFFDYECQNPALITRPPLWKAWSRPRRQDFPSRVPEHLYLCREDGVVCHLEIKRDSSNRLSLNRSKAGTLEASVDAAFGNVDLIITGSPWPVTVDGIIFCGDLCDGRVVGVGSVDQTLPGKRPRIDAVQFELRGNLFNWAPFNDITKVPSRPKWSNGLGGLPNGGATTLMAKPDSLWTTSGKAPRGSLCELRYGCEMRWCETYSLEQYAHSTRSWLFQGMEDVGAFVLLTSPEKTALLRDLLGEDTFVHEISDEETLAAYVVRPTMSFWRTLLVQVRVSKIELYAFDDGEPCLMNSWEAQETHLAALNTRDDLILLANGSRITLFHLFASNKDSGLQEAWTHNLNGRPTCLCFIDRREKLKDEDIFEVKPAKFTGLFYIAIGFQGGKLSIFTLDSNYHLRQESLNILNSAPMDRAMAVCHSVGVVTPRNSTPEKDTYLLCGLRDGYLLAFSLAFASDGSVEITAEAQFQFGYSLVQVQSESQGTDPTCHRDPSTALITCDGTGYHLQYNIPSLRHPNISMVHIVKCQDRSIAPGPISILTGGPEIRKSTSTDQIAGPELSQTMETCFADTLAICGNEMILGKLNPQSVGIPRRIAMRGSPSQTIFSSHFGRLIVSSTCTRVQLGRRFVWPAVFIVDTGAPHVGLNKDHDVPTEFQGLSPLVECSPGSKINCMLEWVYERNGKAYCFLVVGTSTSRSDGRVNGCLKFFNLQQEPNQQMAASWIKDCSYEDPVLSVCQPGNGVILCCSGRGIWKQDYVPSDKKLNRPKLLRKLSSRPCHISAKGPYIFVSTEINSLHVFRLDEDSLMKLSSDDRARNGLSHLVLPRSQTVLFSNRDQSLVGTRVKPISEDLRNAPNLFESRLPVSIKRLCQASVRPLWKRREIDGILDQDILGIATDGSLYTFDILKEPLWRLLRFTQNMCLRDPRICPFASSRPRLTEPIAKEPPDYHVDGDILRRLSNHFDAERILGEMIDSPGTLSSHGKVLETSDGRRRRFTELLREALDECSQNHEPDMVEDCRRHFEGTLGGDTEHNAIDLMRIILRLPL